MYKTRVKIAILRQRSAMKTDSGLRGKVESGYLRKKAYGANWARVNINDFMKKWVTNYTKTNVGCKIYYEDTSTGWVIIVDSGGWYCRLARRVNFKKRPFEYYDMDGKNARNKILPSGKQMGRSNGEWQRVTHFAIKRRDEM